MKTIPDISIPVYAIRDNGFEKWYKLTKRHGVIIRNNNDVDGLVMIFSRFHGKELKPIGLGEAWGYNIKSPVFEDVNPADIENIMIAARERFNHFVVDGTKSKMR